VVQLQWRLRSDQGQSTVEYAVVLGALAAVLAALGALWRTFSSDLLVTHGLMAASHHVQAAVGWAVDVFLF